MVVRRLSPFFNGLLRVIILVSRVADREPRNREYDDEAIAKPPAEHDPLPAVVSLMGLWRYGEYERRLSENHKTGPRRHGACGRSGRGSSGTCDCPGAHPKAGPCGQGGQAGQAACR